MSIYCGLRRVLFLAIVLGGKLQLSFIWLRYSHGFHCLRVYDISLSLSLSLPLLYSDLWHSLLDSFLALFGHSNENSLQGLVLGLCSSKSPYYSLPCVQWAGDLISDIPLPLKLNTYIPISKIELFPHQTVHFLSAVLKKLSVVTNIFFCLHLHIPVLLTLSQ